MPSLAAAAAARRAGEALRRGVMGGRYLSSLRPSPATAAAPDSDEVTARLLTARLAASPHLRDRSRDIPSLTLYRVWRVLPGAGGRQGQCPRLRAQPPRSSQRPHYHYGTCPFYHLFRKIVSAPFGQSFVGVDGMPVCSMPNVCVVDDVLEHLSQSVGVAFDEMP